MTKKISAAGIAARATVFTAIIGGIFLLINTLLNQKRESVKPPNSDNTTINGNQNTIIKGDSNTVINSVIIKEDQKSVMSENGKNKFKEQVSILPENKLLYYALKKNYNLSISNSAAKKITIIATGNITPVKDSDLYSYSGGYIALSVNGAVCHTFNNFPLSATPNYGNSKYNIEEYLSAEIRKNIEAHFNQVASQIYQCAK